MDIIKSKAINYFLWVTILSLPFERLLTLEIFGYTVKISYVAAILVVAYFGYFLVFKKIRWKIATEEWALIILVVLSYLSIFWSIDKGRSLIISSMMLLSVLLFVSVRRLIDKKKLQKYFSAIIWLGFVASLFAFWQFIADGLNIGPSFLRYEYTKAIFSFPRVQSTFLEPLFFANFLLIPIFLQVKNICKNNAKWSDLAILFVIGTAFFLTLSRGAIFALILSLLILGIVIIVKYRHNLKQYLLSLIIFCLSFATCLMMIFALSGYEGTNNYLGHASVNDVGVGESVIGRQEIYQIALTEWMSHPFGIGAGAFGALPQFRDNIARDGYQTANNQYLELLVENGFVGLLLFLGFVILLIKYLVEEIKKEGFSNLIYLVITIALLFQFLTFSTFYIIYIWVFWALIWTKKFVIS